jgi:hypothetical protein
MLMFMFNFCIIWHATEHNLQIQSTFHLDSRMAHHKVSGKNSAHKQHDNFIRELLDNAHLTLPDEIMDQDIPTQADIFSQYGSHPIMHNLDSCSDFRASVSPMHRMMGVAGLFNTGTNYLAALLENNCHLAQRTSHQRLYPFREQVPWGKHNTPNAHRGKHLAMGNGGATWSLNYTWVLPVVIVKDPMHWMVSNCRHEYFLWEHDELHCPNVTVMNEAGEIVPNEFDVDFAKEKRHFTSLVHFWNEWYGEYNQQSGLYPLVYIRFEDLVFHTEYVIRSLCDCIGSSAPEDHDEFMYLEESAKNYAKVHAGASGFVDAMLRYGNPDRRLDGWTKMDYDYAMDNLDEELMNKFGYQYPEWN